MLIVRGESDTRLRAVWRVLVAAVLFLELVNTVGVLVASALGPLHGGDQRLAMLITSVTAGVFGLLYVHTEELALPIGAHAAANFVSSAVVLTGNIPGPGFVSDWAYPKIAVAYLVVLAWLYWRRGEVAIEGRIAEWPGQ